MILILCNTSNGITTLKKQVFVNHSVFAKKFEEEMHMRT
jgi:hypothetical protein